jgi:hypothetical protein
VPLDHHRYCVPFLVRSGRDGLSVSRSRFHVDPDGPNESQQLATNRRDHLLFALASRGQCSVAGVQPVLRFPCDLIKVDRALHPRKVALRPRLHRGRRSAAVPQQEFAQPMARAQLVLLRRFSRADEIPQRFVRRVGHPHRRQVTRRCLTGPSFFTSLRIDSIQLGMTPNDRTSPAGSAAARTRRIDNMMAAEEPPHEEDSKRQVQHQELGREAVQ